MKLEEFSDIEREMVTPHLALKRKINIFVETINDSITKRFGEEGGILLNPRSFGLTKDFWEKHLEKDYNKHWDTNWDDKVGAYVLSFREKQINENKKIEETNSL
jgi:hypothetical protein